jgi:hypothetical protein
MKKKYSKRGSIMVQFDLAYFKLFYSIEGEVGPIYIISFIFF